MVGISALRSIKSTSLTDGPDLWICIGYLLGISDWQHRMKSAGMIVIGASTKSTCYILSHSKGGSFREEQRKWQRR